LWSPGLYNLPRLLSLTVLLVALLSLLKQPRFQMPEGSSFGVPLAIPPMAALSFLLLGFSIRLARWERIDLTHDGSARLPRVCACAAALFALADSVFGVATPSGASTPFLVAACQAMMASVLVLAASRKALFFRRVLLACVVLVSLWLLMVHLYSAGGPLSYEWKSDAASAVLLLCLAGSLFLYESRAGLIPVGLTNWLGLRQSFVLLVAALAIPIFLGWIRTLVSRHWDVPEGLGTAVHVLATMVALAPFISLALASARERYERQLMTLQEFEAAERAYAELLSKGSEFYLALGFNGQIHQANENARRFFGIEAKGGRAPHLSAILTEESAGKLASTGRNLLTNLAAQPLLNFRSSSGEAMPLYVSAACRFHRGQPEEILLVGRSLPLGLRAPGTSSSLLPKGD
jgi:hypothetical protein